MVTGLSPIQSVIIQVITNSEDREAGVRFAYHTSIITERIERHEVH